VPPDPPNPGDATLLMTRAAGGDRVAADQLLPLVYDQLRRAAQLQMGGERTDHTLSATALVHEAYLKLVGPRPPAPAPEANWAGRAHFYAAAAEAMRRILLDHAKARGRDKRGGRDGKPATRRDFSSVGELASAEPDEILSFDSALCRLETESADAARVVRLRFFAGLTVEQVAHAMDISERTANRLWTFARAWLHRDLREGESKEQR
jgi:RNA polymerase sigma factor (TIGR02999 family)